MKNLNYSLNYVILDLPIAILYVFIDGSFINNKDLSSQIRFIIILVNEFNLYRNLIYQSLMKSKRVTKSVLTLEIYGIVAGTNLAYIISLILAKITNQLDLSTTLSVVCTDLYSLYKYLVKLSITKEKRLIINIITLC